MHQKHSEKSSRPPLIFISAAEPSADLYGAALIRAARNIMPNARFIGVAGPRMVEAGCHRIFDMSAHAAMLAGAFGAVGRGIRMLNTSEAYLRRFPFAAAVLIDSPTLHLPLAGRAQAAGVPVLYYVAPQMWAWGAHRIHKLRNRVRKVACILPFEEEYFRNQGVDATFVGHPLAEIMAGEPIDERMVASIRAQGAPVVTLLPGSRKHVVREVLKGQLEVARAIVEAFPRSVIGVSVANEQVRPIVEDAVRAGGVDVKTFSTHRGEWIRAADLVLVASGTTTLEVAFHARPMIVMYNASRLMYHLVARWMVRTPFYSLPNILAQREIVPEFMPYYTSTKPIADRAIDLLRSESRRAEMSAELERVVEPLRSDRASLHTAELLRNLRTIH